MVEVDPLVINVTSVFDDDRQTRSGFIYTSEESVATSVLISQLFENTIPT
jgi:hypothetical protein